MACGLGNIQKVRDGEPLGGGQATAESDFAGIGRAPAAEIDPLTGMPVGDELPF